jgi:hypothetical protein
VALGLAMPTEVGTLMRRIPPEQVGSTMNGAIGQRRRAWHSS